MAQPEAQRFVDKVGRLLDFLIPLYQREGKSYLTVGLGCTGGRHRSPVLARELMKRLDSAGFEHSPRPRHRPLSLRLVSFRAESADGEESSDRRHPSTASWILRFARNDKSRASRLLQFMMLPQSTLMRLTGHSRRRVEREEQRDARDFVLGGHSVSSRPATGNRP